MQRERCNVVHGIVALALGVGGAAHCVAGTDSASPDEHTYGGACLSRDDADTPVPPTAALELNRPGEHRLTSDLTADGTAVVINASDVTLDLGGHVVTYDMRPNECFVYGVYVARNVDRVTIKNGYILQGAGKTADSPAIYLYGGYQRGPHVISDLVIRTVGFQSNGIQADHGYSFNNSEIARTYIEVLGETDAMDGYGADPIIVSARNEGGVLIHHNILVGGHRGINLVDIGSEVSNESKVHDNRIQHRRRPGSKAPYGIHVAGRSHDVHVFDNQIISDEGRGIIFDGWGQGVLEGASGNSAYRNRIDVQYTTRATSGEYVENNVMGIYDRYGSGENTFRDNTILVSNEQIGAIFGIYIGSDEADPLMHDLVAANNTIIARRGKERSYAFRFNVAESISAVDNKYIADGFSTGDENVAELDLRNNSILSLPTTGKPAAPTGVRIARFLDSCVIEWDANKEEDVFEYVVYRDGKRLPVSPRGGTFYVDTNVEGAHTYAVSAVTLSGTVGPRSEEVPTTASRNAWW